MLRLHVSIGAVRGGCLLLVITASFASHACSSLGAPQPATPGGTPEVTAAQVERWARELSNHGRWGEDDELGTLNLITPAKRRAAAALVRDGVSISLARDVEKEAAVDNSHPFEHTMLAGGGGDEGPWAFDLYAVAYHGFVHTHIDALSHFVHEGELYNGFSGDVIEESGATRLGIENMKDGIFTRAVLVDLPRLRGVDWLEPGTAIGVEDLEAWEERAGVRVAEGDALLIRTGRWPRRDALGAWSVTEVGVAGLHVSVVPWLRERGVAVLGSDAASDVGPSGFEAFPAPVHLLALHALGMPILDNLELERVAAEAEKRGRWAFLLTAAPLAVPGGTGSPLNPIAIF